MSTGIPEGTTHRAVRIALRGGSAALMSVGIAAVVITTACYSYDPRSVGEITAGDHIVATVNNVGRVALTADIGDDVQTVEGDLVSSDANGIRMRVTEANFLSGASTPMAGINVLIPPNGIVGVTTKKFSRANTAIVIVGLAAALVAAFKAFGIIGSGNGDAAPKPTLPPGSS